MSAQVKPRIEVLGGQASNLTECLLLAVIDYFTFLDEHSITQPVFAPLVETDARLCRRRSTLLPDYHEWADWRLAQVSLPALTLLHYEVPAQVE